MIGHLVDGKYQILRLLGQGGMGAVYEGVHTGTGRRVAIKIIATSLERNDEMISRFHREARAAGQIDTQHIVQVFDTGIDGLIGAPFMVMELLSGQDVAQLIHRIGPLPPDLALRIVAQACVGLQKAHEAGVVHRDVKPANLFLARREAGEVIVKILDFGIAKMKVEEGGGPTAHALTRTGAMLGSPLYMSPEQAKGLKTIDARSDIWSLGAVLYEALTARTPHHHIESLGQLIIAICGEPPKPVQDFAPWVPPEVAAIAHGALVLDPAGRFQSAAAMLEAMRPLLPQGATMHEVMLAPMPNEHRKRVEPRLVITATGAPVVSTRLGTGSVATVTGGSRRLGAAVAIASAVAIVGGGGLLAMRARNAPGPVIATAEPSVPIVPTASAPPPAPTASSVAALRQVRVAIAPTLPSDASVSVDGAAASIDGGSVGIEGALGSVHAVVVRVGHQERTTAVSITDEGALPDRIDVAALLPSRGGPPAHPSATAARTAKPVSTSAPADTAKKAPSNISRTDPDL